MRRWAVAPPSALEMGCLLLVPCRPPWAPSSPKSEQVEAEGQPQMGTWGLGQKTQTLRNGRETLKLSKPKPFVFSSSPHSTSSWSLAPTKTCGRWGAHALPRQFFLQLSASSWKVLEENWLQLFCATWLSRAMNVYNKIIAGPFVEHHSGLGTLHALSC